MRQHPSNERRHLRPSNQTPRRELIIRRPPSNPQLEHPLNRRILTTRHAPDVSKPRSIRRNIPQLIHTRLAAESALTRPGLDQKRVQHRSHLRPRHRRIRREPTAAPTRHDPQPHHLIDRRTDLVRNTLQVREVIRRVRQQRHTRRTRSPRQEQRHLPTQHRSTRIIRSRRTTPSNPIMPQTIHRVLSKRPNNINQTQRLQRRTNTRRIHSLIIRLAIHRRRRNHPNSQQRPHQTQHHNNSQPRPPHTHQSHQTEPFPS